MRRLMACLAVLACCGALAACGGKKDETITTGSAPANQAVMKLAAPSDNGLLGFNDWPKACDLLTEADIRTVLPQTAKTTRDSGNQTLKFYDLGPGPDEMTVLDVYCRTTIWLPGRDLDEEIGSSEVSVEVGFAGTTALAEQNYERYLKEDGQCPEALAPLGLDECSRGAVTAFVFRKHGVVVKVDWPAWYPYVDAFAGQGEGEFAIKDYWRDHVMPEFVKAIVGKLP